MAAATRRPSHRDAHRHRARPPTSRRAATAAGRRGTSTCRAGRTRCRPGRRDARARASTSSGRRARAEHEPHERRGESPHPDAEQGERREHDGGDAVAWPSR
jgi:hypothetical protein